MFERVVSYFLQKYLGWLVKGLDDALNVSIWGSDIVLNNLELQENALDFYTARPSEKWLLATTQIADTMD